MDGHREDWKLAMHFSEKDLYPELMRRTQMKVTEKSVFYGGGE